MNLQSLLAEFGNAVSAPNQANQNVATHNQGAQADASSSPVQGALSSLKANFPGGLAGGAAAGGLVALLLSSKSTRKIAKKAAKFGGTAVLGGLAYKAYSNWQQNKALNQIEPIQNADIQQAAPLLSHASANAMEVDQATIDQAQTALELVLVKAMIAAAKADGQIDSVEQKRLHSAVKDLNLSAEHQSQLFALMAAETSVQEIASLVSSEEARAEVYLAAYLAIEVDDQRERAFLNDLSLALKLPRGLAAYLEQQADQGVTAD